MESQQIKLSIEMEFKNGVLAIKSLETSEMPLSLSIDILTSIQTRVEYFYEKKKEE